MSSVVVKILIAALMNARTSAVAKLCLDQLGLKYVRVSLSQRIGHLALECDAFLRDHILNNGRKPIAVLVEPQNGNFANPVLVEYLSKYITIVPRIARADLVSKALVDGGYAVNIAPYAVAMYETALCYDVYRRWGRRAPLFTLTRDDEAATKGFLSRLGVPEGAWFVCMHARGGGYSPVDEHWHVHRNVDIGDYAEAMDRIIARGGWCIRMGDATMDPMPPRGRVIDYACSEYKSSRLDIGLVASCRFFVGCASGLYNVAAMFGRPSALVNTTPLSGGYALGPDDLAIPQGIFDASGRPIPVEEVLASEVGNFRKADEFRASGLTPRNVTPAEIAALVEEMMDRLDGTAKYTTADEIRQERFRALLRPGHYAHGTGSRLGRDYLRARLPLSGTASAVACAETKTRSDIGLVSSGRPASLQKQGGAHISEHMMGKSEQLGTTAGSDVEYISDNYSYQRSSAAAGPLRSEWTILSGAVADELISTFSPKRVFDAGCGRGFLVEALRDRGIETYGRDISQIAIGQVRPDMRGYCAAGSLIDPIDGGYDLVTCIEVLEHMSAVDGMRAITNLSQAASTIVMSSTSNLEASTHLNASAPLDRINAFADHGFSPIVELAFQSLPAHTMVFQRTPERPSAAVMVAYAEVIRCRIQLSEARQSSSNWPAPDAAGMAMFDAVYYMRANPDVVDAGCDPLEHYVLYGRAEGRFANAAMAAAFADIVTTYQATRDM